MIYNIALAAILAILATGTLYFLLLKERSIMGPLWRAGLLSWGGAFLFMVLLLLAGCNVSYEGVTPPDSAYAAELCAIHGGVDQVRGVHWRNEDGRDTSLRLDIVCRNNAKLTYWSPDL